MDIVLTLLRCPDSVVPEQRRVSGGDFVLGRGADSGWVLSDPDRLLSKHHCVLEFRAGGWQVRDLSLNGTFVNHAQAPLGRDATKPLEDGDRLRLGAYEIEVRMEEGSAQSPWAAPPASSWEQRAAPAPVPAAQWHDDPSWARQGPPARDEPLAPRLPGDPYAPPAPSAAPLPSGSGLPMGNDPFENGPAMPDHRPSTSDAFLPPRPMQQVSVIPDNWDLGPSPAAPARPAAPPAGGGVGRIPEDWNFDPSPAPAPAAAAPPARHPAEGSWGPGAVPPPAPPAAETGWGPAAAPPPPAETSWGPGPAPQAAPPPGEAAPWAPAAAPLPPAADPSWGPGAAPRPAAPGPAPLPSAGDPSWGAAVAPPGPPAARPAEPPRGADPFAEDALPPRAAPASAPPMAPPMAPPGAPPAMPAAAAPPGAAGSAAAGLAAFLAGAGLPPSAAAQADPEAALRALGAALHASVAGLRQLLIARADVKREFRIEQTMLRHAGNNPVKFAATDEQALAALIAGGQQAGPRAVHETVEDLTAHQVATLAATQAAARALLARLAPGALEAQDQSGGGLFGASREKRLWDAYKRLHQQVTDQFDDDFDSAFGKEFARAYEQASRRER